MNTQIDRNALADAILSAGEPDAQYAAWTLDELDSLADLGSVRSAWASADEPGIAGLGYEPVGFTSSAAALQSFRASPERFDAVLSDEAMPDMTGSELAKEIRAIRPDIPIVLMSGFVSPALLGRARDLGVMEVLAKPLIERDIARGLANALRNGARP